MFTQRIRSSAPVMAGAAMLILSPPSVMAQSEELFACYVPGSGVMYRINPPGSPGQNRFLKDDCRGRRHVKFSWARLVAPEGKVGIGVPNPSAELDVAGDVHASGKLMLGNTITIDDATNSITSSSGTLTFVDENVVTSGTIESTGGGFKFPDGTLQHTAALGGGTWNLTGNAGTDGGATNFLGTTDNVAFEIHVAGRRTLRVEPKSESSNVLAGAPENGVPGIAVNGATIGGGGSAVAANRVTGNWGTIGGGRGNIVPVAGTVAGGEENTVVNTAGTIGGGQQNTAHEGGTVGGGRRNVAGVGSTVGGGADNMANNLSTVIAGGSANVISERESTIGGGSRNVVTAPQVVVAGGVDNRAESSRSVIGGGSGNLVSGINAQFATIGGGQDNVVMRVGDVVGGGRNNTANGVEATVAGGVRNVATGERSVVGGGLENTASGNWATVPGGEGNTASGAHSFAAGNNARAINPGTFVWSHGEDSDFTSTGTNQFLIRASGGVGIGTNAPSTILSVVRGSATDPIADAWTTYSSRRWKTNIRPVVDALDLVRRLRGVTFEWTEDGRPDIGLIAEEVGEVVPEVVAYEANGVDARSVDYARLVAVLIEAVKAQQIQIEELQREVATLRSR